MKYAIHEIGRGDSAIDRTVEAMGKLARAAMGKKPIVVLASAIVRNGAAGVGGQSTGGRSTAALDVYNYLADPRNMVFQEDPPKFELVHDPVIYANELLARRGPVRGDCDDRSTLGAALLGALGLAPVFIVVQPTGDTEYKHVLFGYMKNAARGVADLDNIVPMDPQERFQPGQWIPGVARMKVYAV